MHITRLLSRKNCNAGVNFRYQLTHTNEKILIEKVIYRIILLLSFLQRGESNDQEEIFETLEYAFFDFGFVNEYRSENKLHWAQKRIFLTLLIQPTKHKTINSRDIYLTLSHVFSITSHSHHRRKQRTLLVIKELLH